jgi:hypothetical protein
MGLMLGQANTDAVNRASRFSYGEATGITQTVRNYGASLGFAVLGTVLISEFRSKITDSLTAKGAPGPVAAAQAAKIAQLQGGNGNPAAIPPPSRRSSAPTTPAPPRPCSTSCARSWQWRRWWRCAGSPGASSRKTARTAPPSWPARTRTPNLYPAPS